MNINNSCPCCSESMLLHLNSRYSYWFCSHCRLEMSNSDSQANDDKSKVTGLNSASLKSKRSVVAV